MSRGLLVLFAWIWMLEACLLATSESGQNIQYTCKWETALLTWENFTEIAKEQFATTLGRGHPLIWSKQHKGGTPTSSMSKESAFSVRSWASWGGTRMGGAFSGVEVKVCPSLTTWMPSPSVLWLVDWRSADSGRGSVSLLCCSGLTGH